MNRVKKILAAFGIITASCISLLLMSYGFHLFDMDSTVRNWLIWITVFFSTLSIGIAVNREKLQNDDEGWGVPSSEVVKLIAAKRRVNTASNNPRINTYARIGSDMGKTSRVATASRSGEVMKKSNEVSLEDIKNRVLELETNQTENIKGSVDDIEDSRPDDPEVEFYKKEKKSSPYEYIKKSNIPIYKFLEKNPKCNMNDLCDAFPKCKYTSLANIRYRFLSKLNKLHDNGLD